MQIIKYQLMTEVNRGTEEEPNIVQTFNDKEVQCSSDTLEAALSTAQQEAYNGEYIVEDIPMTEDEARLERDRLLAETDWTQVLDAPISSESREAFRVYRQALRDVPEQAGFPEAIEWPVMPEVVKAAPDPVDTAMDALLGEEDA